MNLKVVKNIIVKTSEVRDWPELKRVGETEPVSINLEFPEQKVMFGLLEEEREKLIDLLKKVRMFLHGR